MNSRYTVMLHFVLALLFLICNSCNLLKRDFLQPLRFLYVPGVQDPFYTTLEKGIREKAATLQVEIIITTYPLTWSPEAQIKAMNESLKDSQHIDAILIAPVANDVLIEPLRTVYQKGIEIITVDTYIGDGNYEKRSEYSFPLTYIGSDNELGGKLMAEHIATLVKEKGYPLP